MTTTTTDTHVDVAILGSGFSGLGMAIRLKQSGFEDFVVLERGDEVGGTWHYNTYPGCACDVPSHLYSFSFAPNPEWSHTYSPQPEIRDYLRRCADDFGVRPHIRLGHEVTAAEWDDDERRWHVATSQGDFTARVLVSGLGPLTEPKIPEIPGLETFEGETFHSARWNHDYDLDGKRVASIGTGASAIQYVPAIQPQVRQLHVFQRTPPWIAPHGNRPITGLERRLYRALPAAQRAVRGGVYAARELLVLGFVKNPRLMKVVERVAERHMRRFISDPELIRKVTPDYTIGCKRILPSNKWYGALTKPNVELVTEGVKAVRPKSIVSADGVERLRHRLPRDRHAGRALRARAPRHAAVRGLGSERSRVPRDGRRRLPQPVPPARPEHRPRAHLDGLHDRVADPVRDGRAAHHARPPARDRGGHRVGRRALQR
jgi:cation diffusion facilitator CzcD-associated flavoprotein CzcO